MHFRLDKALRAAYDESVRLSMTKSEQVRADALADAETLRLNLLHAEGAAFRRSGKARAALRLAENMQAAIYVNLFLRTEPNPEDVWMADDGRRAARAAFRAVPGLRGE